VQVLIIIDQKNLMKKNKKIRIMWKVVGLEDSPKNDKNLYSSLDQAELHAPIPSWIKKIEIIEL